MMTFQEIRPFVIQALAWARWAMPATAFVVDALWVLNVAPTASPVALRRRRGWFTATARCSQPRCTRGFYGLLAVAVIAIQRDAVRARIAAAATVEEARPFGDHEAAVHNVEPRSVTLRECVRETAAAA